MARKNLPTRFLRNMQIGDYIIQSLYNNVINQDSQKIGWQTLSLLIMSKSFEKRVCLTAFAESEFYNGLANSDLPKRSETFKKGMPDGICPIGIRQPISMLCWGCFLSYFFVRKKWNKIISIYGL